jgi:enoyl-CoA hydratase
MQFQDLKVEIADGIATVVVNRPDVRNALRVETVEELRSALDDLRGREEAGVVVFTGAGDKAFVSGRDIRDLLKLGRRDALEHRLSGLYREIELFEKVTIAAVNGYALGGGLEFALACDIRIASDNAVLGLPETRLGIIPAAGGTQRLPRIVGLGIAKHMILTGESLPAARALEVGLVTQICPAPELQARARELASKILERGPLATRLAKTAINISMQTPLEAGLQAEKLSQAILFESGEKIEGVNAFLEKRKPRFHGGAPEASRGKSLT